MPVKSVIDIDLDDQKFARFKELFDKYSEVLAKTPGMWKSASKEQHAMSTAFERQTASILAQVALSKESDDAEKKRLERLGTSDRLWTNISHSSSTIAKNVLDIGAGVLKWGSIIGGGLLGGALFGLDRLGQSTSNERRSATGLGLSIGQQQAFGTNFSRFVDTSSFLSGINTAVSDVSKQGPLYALGVNPNQSTEAVALDTLKALQRKARSTPENQLGILASAYGTSNFGIGAEDLRRLRAPGTELEDQFGHYRQDVKAFGIGDDTARKWQDFTTQLSRAGETIQKIFVDGLGPLTGPLEHLSAALVKTLSTMMEKGGPIENGINLLAEWIENFSLKVASDRFQHGVDNFMQAIGDMARVMHNVAHPYDTTVDWTSRKIEGGIKAVSGFISNPPWEKKVYLKRLAELDDIWGLPADTLERQFQKESSGNFHVKDNASGHMGVFQFDAATAKRFGIDPHNPYQSAEAAAQYDSELRDKYGGDLQKALAAYNGAGHLDQIIRDHPSDWLKYTKPETQNYVGAIAPGSAGVRIEINNNTGGNAVVAASQLAP